MDNLTDGNAAHCLQATQEVDNRVLKDVVVYVEVRSSNVNRSECVGRELEQLGATVVKKFTNDVTHVVFREGCNRTKAKAEKLGIHLVSVLWVENCKQSRAHVLETMYPPILPSQNGTPLFMTKLKKVRWMQPRNFEQALICSADKPGRRRKKNEAAKIFSTPYSSPRPAVLVQDTQPTSQEEYVCTPIHLAIPDTPPSMREKFKQIKLAKEAAAGSSEDKPIDSDIEERHKYMKQLQRKLFVLNGGEFPCEIGSPSTNSVFMSDNEKVNTTCKVIENKCKPDVGIAVTKHQLETKDQLNASSGISDNSINDDMKIAQTINSTISNNRKSACLGMDLDENLFSSDEISFSAEIDNQKSEISIVKQCAGVCLSPVNYNKGTKVIAETLALENQEHCKYLKENNGTLAIKKRKQSFGSKISNKENFLVIDNKIQLRRSSRRMSVQHIIAELDISSTLDLMENDEKMLENGKIAMSKSSQNADVVSCDISRDNTKDKSLAQFENIDNSCKAFNQDHDVAKPRKGCKSVPVKKRKSLPENAKRRSRKSANIDISNEPKCVVSPVTNTDSISQDKDLQVKKLVTDKKTTKKKLMSLTDLYEQHSVLINPNICSLEEQSVLKPVKKVGKKNISSGNNPSDTYIHESEVDSNSTKSQDLGKIDKVKPKKGSKRQSTSKINETQKTSRQPKDRDDYAIRNYKTQNGKKAFIADIYIDETEASIRQESISASVDNVTTQVNQTKDNSLVYSSNETLSLSMSRAYNDSNMPSFVLSSHRCRPSIEEFKSSQNKRLKKIIKHSDLLTANQNETLGKMSLSESDQSFTRGMTINFNKCQRKNSLPSLVMTSLHADEQDIVISVVKKLGAFVISESVNETTTHVICGEPRRTLNILQCLARGIWLLSKEWVLKSLETGCWIAEQDFECDAFFPKCKIARLEREKCTGMYKQSVFSGLGPVYISDRSSPPRPQLIQLFKLCGGQVTGVREQASVYIGSDYHPGLMCVKPKWLLDSITSHQALPLEKYLLDKPKRDISPVY